MLEVTLKLSRKDIDAAIIEAAEKEIIAGYRRDLTSQQVFYEYDENGEVEAARFTADITREDV